MLLVSTFLLGCAMGCLLLYSSVHDRIVKVPGLALVGQVEGCIQSLPDGSLAGVQLYNGTSYHLVITEVRDAQGNPAEFVQFHVTKPVGRGYASASRAVPLSEVIPNRCYGILLPGDNAVLKFNAKGRGPVSVSYYLVGEKPEVGMVKILKLE